MCHIGRLILQRKVLLQNIREVNQLKIKIKKIYSTCKHPCRNICTVEFS